MKAKTRKPGKLHKHLANKSGRGKRPRRKPKATSLHVLIQAAQAASKNGGPRPRVKLPEAFRAIGLDEYGIAQCFAEQIEDIRHPDKKKRISRKLLLDFLKECVRVLYAPARRGDALEQPAKIELVHFVPRPDRSNDKPASPVQASSFGANEPQPWSQSAEAVPAGHDVVRTSPAFD
ncbi:MAG TPA: hypothetical protein VJN21_13445 [Candidatus Acidoferrales bacterium]|nr:hypothetical protein [Candidatus Acidoferrales bacterium]